MLCRICFTDEFEPQGIKQYDSTLGGVPVQLAYVHEWCKGCGQDTITPLPVILRGEE